MPAKIRKIIVQVDETRIEMGRSVSPPTRKALAMAVIENPFAGQYTENLDALIAIGEELGALLGQRCVEALGIEPGQAHSYGKAAIVGDDERDIVAGKAAGMTTVAAHYGYLGSQAEVLSWGADHIIHSPLALAELLAQA